MLLGVAEKATNPLGRAGETVSRNIKRLREEQRLTFVELADRLSKIGRPIPVLGLRRIERGERRVDVDDLFAFAEVFGVAPSALLPEDEKHAELLEIAFALAVAQTTGTGAHWALARIFKNRVFPDERLIKLGGLSATPAGKAAAQAELDRLGYGDPTETDQLVGERDSKITTGGESAERDRASGEGDTE
jgi:transcriptional regulator with XRE-family HTH domain